ncbi:MAG: hypothetical protein ACTHU0_08885 [Kofleriaceae bacterium]
MKIVMRDDRVFEGTELEIVCQMRELAFEAADKSISEYVSWVVSNAGKLDAVELQVRGDTDDELAAALVSEMLRNKLARTESPGR